MKIFLVGLPGSGKSTLGKELSAFLQYRFIDTDDEIIKNEESSIEDIFKNKGEVYFRECERNTLNKIISQENIIVSTGGGFPCFNDNMEIINKNGTSIFLNVSPSILADRLLAHENQNRPLIKGKSRDKLLEFLYEKLKERRPFYKKSKLEFEGSDINAKQIVNKLRLENLI